MCWKIWNFGYLINNNNINSGGKESSFDQRSVIPHDSQAHYSFITQQHVPNDFVETFAKMFQLLRWFKYISRNGVI